MYNITTRTLFQKVIQNSTLLPAKTDKITHLNSKKEQL